MERGAAARPLQESEIEIDVRAAGLNFRDVMYAMGLLPDEAIEDGFCGPSLGMELSFRVVSRAVGPGVDFSPGDEVIAIAPASFANRARTKAFAVTRKPPEWSFAAAATVPTAFFTAYYALVELARLQPGERVRSSASCRRSAASRWSRSRSTLALKCWPLPAPLRSVTSWRLLGADHGRDSRSLTSADEVHAGHRAAPALMWYSTPSPASPCAAIYGCCAPSDA